MSHIQQLTKDATKVHEITKLNRKIFVYLRINLQQHARLTKGLVWSTWFGVAP